MVMARVNVGGWAAYETLTSAQMNQLDINMTYALDGNAGGDYSPSSLLKVHGKILGEDEDYRYFNYPLAHGRPESDGDWVYDFTNFRWTSDNVATRQIIFSFNRFLQDGLRLRFINLQIDQNTSQAVKANRMRVQLWSVARFAGATYKFDDSYHPDPSGGLCTGYFPRGTHDGGDGLAALSDSAQNWQTNWFVGGTVYNETDGSSGVITANTTTGITATLSGGTDNDWDDDDVYRIDMNYELSTQGNEYILLITNANTAMADEIRAMAVYYGEEDYLIAP